MKKLTTKEIIEKISEARKLIDDASKIFMEINHEWNDVFFDDDAYHLPYTRAGIIGGMLFNLAHDDSKGLIDLFKEIK